MSTISPVFQVYSMKYMIIMQQGLVNTAKRRITEKTRHIEPGEKTVQLSFKYLSYPGENRAFCVVSD